VDPTQLYETVVVNRDPQAPPADDYAMRFVTIPARSLTTGEVPPVELLAKDLGLEQMAKAEPWSLPFLLDAILGRFPDYPWVLEVWGPGSRRRGEGPSTFAQHLAYEPVVPFESSPLQGRSLAGILAAGGVSAGAAVGFVEGQVVAVLAVPAGIIVIGAASGAAEAFQIGIRTKMLAWMGVPDPAQSSSTDDPPPQPPPPPPHDD
jgi:hypothetical protein